MSRETELERQARRERDSWDTYRRVREEEGIQENGNEWGSEKEVYIDGERYVKHRPRESYSRREPPAPPPPPPPPSVASERPPGGDHDGVSQIRRFFGDLGERLYLRNSQVNGNQEPGRRAEAEGATESMLTPFLGLLSGLNLGNGTVAPPPLSSFSRSRPSRGPSHGQSLPTRGYPMKNTAEVMTDFNAAPNPFHQASQERHCWRNERPSGVEYVESRAASIGSSSSRASSSRRYPPAPTAMTVPDSDSDFSNEYQQRFGDEHVGHRVYRVPSYRMNPRPDPGPPQDIHAPSANMRRRRRRDLGEELPTVPENRGASAHRHRRDP